MNRFCSGERASARLRSLYEAYGYTPYKMNKFEEYDLYVRNKDFLISDHIITFTDTDGKLLAMKPDVTLSIVKNGSDEKGELMKVYYNEKVYRVPRDGDSFREITQMGLECVGDLDSYSLYEVLSLAAESLSALSPDFVLDISHMGVLSELLSRFSVAEEDRARVLTCLSEKNMHDLRELPNAELLQKLVSVSGSSSKVAPALTELYGGALSPAAEALLSTLRALEEDGYLGRIRIDFSVLNDMSYYSGIVFKGFLSGIPVSILSGGQYDNLMKKLGRNAGALGFAVDLDILAGYAEDDSAYDVETLLLYDEKTPISEIRRAVNFFSDGGKSVLARRTLPKHLRYKKLVKLDEKGAFTVESDA